MVHLPAAYRYSSTPDDAAAEGREIASRLQLLGQQYSSGKLPAAPDVEGLSWQHLAPDYREVINGLA